MKEMKIGELVKFNIKNILTLLDTNENEFNRLCTEEYSKETFNIAYPFFKETTKINDHDKAFTHEPKKTLNYRYWKDVYTYKGTDYRITNDWYVKNRIKFEEYLRKFVTFVSEVTKVNSRCSNNLNKILYGPPGTGKTYNTINRALEIIDGEVPQSRTNVKSRFEDLSKAGQIEFVTFH